MKERLLGLLEDDHQVRQWQQTPIKEWYGFTVEDMQEFGLHTKVLDWFNNLTDKEILAIARIKPLSLHSSPIYK
jgi:hypothetical protein